MKRGDIWWAELAPSAGRRPVLLLSRDEAYAIRSLVVVVPLTTRIRHIPSEVLLGANDGLPRKCAVNMDSITTIPKGCLREHLTTLSPEKLKDVEEALCFALGIE